MFVEDYFPFEILKIETIKIGNYLRKSNIFLLLLIVKPQNFITFPAILKSIKNRFIEFSRNVIRNSEIILPWIMLAQFHGKK